MLSIFLREDLKQPLSKKNLETTIDLNASGDIIGVEIEAPQYIFGPSALEGLEFIDLAKLSSDRTKTPKGRQLSLHAQHRPPLQQQTSYWISYDKTCDMMYVSVASYVPPQKQRYAISIPVDCFFYLDHRNRIHRIDIPLDEVQKGRALYY